MHSKLTRIQNYHDLVQSNRDTQEIISTVNFANAEWILFHDCIRTIAAQLNRAST